jgi:hypothetical protein
MTRKLPDWPGLPATVDSTVQVPTERHANWGNNRVSTLEALTPEENYSLDLDSPGQFRVTSDGFDPALRETWSREGGFEQNLVRAATAAQDILSRAPDPDTLQFKFDQQLPERIQNKIYDHLRIQPAKGRGRAMIEAFERSLSDEDLDTFVDWFEALDDGEQRAIRDYLYGRAG